MSRKVGFIFIYSNQLPLKSYSEENKIKYKDKILLHSVGIISYLNKEKIKSCILKNLESSVRKNNIYNIIQTDFGIKPAYIIDYNPIPKKLLKTINPKLVIYVVILDIKKKLKISTAIEQTLHSKVFVDNMLLFYNLESIDRESPDIFSTIKNYTKNKNKNSREIILYDDDEPLQTYKIPFYYIEEALLGIEELREETKCYI